MDSKAAIPGQSAACRVVRASGRLRLAAAKRLLGPDRGDAQSARQMLQAAENHGINLTNLWVTLGPEGDAVRQVCLLVEGSGRSAMAFTSSPGSRHEESELADLIRHASEAIEGVDLVQALLEVEERGAKAALVDAGFVGVGTLAYMRRPTPARTDPDPRFEWPEGVSVRRYAPGDDAALMAALDRTYVGTLDCPELCGVRRTADVLESHRATGEWDPDCWWVIETKGDIEGMLLLNPCPDMGTIELVYLGLSVGLRGEGLGRRLLAHCLAHLRGRPEPFITCAVDERNVPAIGAYRKAGFAEFGRRVALIRPVSAR